MKVKCAKCGASLTIGGSLGMIKATLVMTIESPVAKGHKNIFMHRDIEIPYVPPRNDMIGFDGNETYFVRHCAYDVDAKRLKIWCYDTDGLKKSVFSKKKNENHLREYVQKYRDLGWTCLNIGNVPDWTALANKDF